MQLKLFGSGGPSPAFKRDFELLVGLDEGELELLAGWFETAPDVMVPKDAELVALAAGSKLNPEELGAVIGVVRFVLNNWKQRSASLEEIRNDLSILGCDPPGGNRIIRFLSRLENTRDRVYLAGLRRAYETIGLPTIDDVSLLWDIRPMFSDFAYPPEPQGSTLTELLDYTYLLVMEIQASRVDGNSETVSFQLSEVEFEKLMEGMQRAHQQLKALKSARLSAKQ